MPFDAPHHSAFITKKHFLGNGKPFRTVANDFEQRCSKFSKFSLTVTNRPSPCPTACHNQATSANCGLYECMRHCCASEYVRSLTDLCGLQHKMRPEGKNRSTDRVKRARIIGLCEAGFSHSEIARRLGLSRHTVVKWCTRFAENGHLEDAARSGRPPKQTRAFIKAVERALRGRRGTSVRKVQAKLKAQGTVVSRMTVSRAAHAAELRPYSRRIKPILSAAHQRRRRLFARSERDRDWTRVIAADEATFYLCDTPNRRHDLVWVRKGDPIPPILKGKAATKWSLFGAIASSGRVALAVFDERFTKETYVEIMANELLPGADVAFPNDDWAYLHDRSPQHSSKVAQAWLDAYVDRKSVV